MLVDQLKRYMVQLLKLILIITVMEGLILVFFYVTDLMDYNKVAEITGDVFMPVLFVLFGLLLGLSISRDLMVKKGVKN